MNAHHKPKRETVEMVDGRVYFSDDNWTTVHVIPPGGQPRRVTGKAADLARFLAVAQSSAGPA
ncbi:hypothetical protein NKG99_20635 [Mesorhizobium sp. M1409]|uniref:hypothetical protein n=1 Tax=Mesorhizobium sp. M1409 TaxID=2957100 RepID=UPI00333A6F7A